MYLLDGKVGRRDGVLRVFSDGTGREEEHRINTHTYLEELQIVINYGLHTHIDRVVACVGPFFSRGVVV